LLTESYMDHISSGMFPTPRKRIREHTWRKFFTKLKIMYNEMGLALYRDLYRMLTAKEMLQLWLCCCLYILEGDGRPADSGRHETGARGEGQVGGLIYTSQKRSSRLLLANMHRPFVCLKRLRKCEDSHLNRYM
jgi:hypothetical protein